MSKLPVALVATRLLAFLSNGTPVIYVASSEQRAESIAHLLQELAPDAACVFLPAWDCQPYDRASPAPDILGQQLAACRRLDEAQASERSAGAILVTTLEAALQRLPPADAAAETLSFEPGDALETDVFALRLAAFGYRPHGRVDDHGEVAIRSEVIDIFPSGSAPYRLTIENGRISRIHAYDPHVAADHGRYRPIGDRTRVPGHHAARCGSDQALSGDGALASRLPREAPDRFRSPARRRLIDRARRGCAARRGAGSRAEHLPGRARRSSAMRCRFP